MKLLKYVNFIIIFLISLLLFVNLAGMITKVRYLNEVGLDQKISFGYSILITISLFILICLIMYKNGKSIIFVHSTGLLYLIGLWHSMVAKYNSGLLGPLLFVPPGFIFISFSSIIIIWLIVYFYYRITIKNSWYS